MKLSRLIPEYTFWYDGMILYKLVVDNVDPTGQNCREAKWVPVDAGDEVKLRNIDFEGDHDWSEKTVRPIGAPDGYPFGILMIPAGLYALTLEDHE